MASNLGQLSQYEVLQKLGEGSFSQVYKVIRKSDNKQYAMKKIKIGQLSHKEKENALNEIRILASLETPYIVSYKDAFYDNSSSCLCIIMDLAEGGDLLRQIKQSVQRQSPIQEKDIWKALNQILNGTYFILGLKLLHSMKIVHRDLKCANIFIGKDNTYLLGDLNVSKVAKQGLVKTQTGTPYYASPEVWGDKPYDQKCDIWSLGCIIYEMAAGSPPFKATDLKNLYQKIKRGLYDPIPKLYSADLHIIIKELLQVNPASRPNASDLLSNPIIMRRCVGTNVIPNQIRPSSQELLNTIKLPNNLNLLHNNLPKSKFKDLNNSYEKKSEVVPVSPIRKRHPSQHLELENINYLNRVDSNRPRSQQVPRQPLSNRNLPRPPSSNQKIVICSPVIAQPTSARRAIQKTPSERLFQKQPSERQLIKQNEGPKNNQNIKAEIQRLQQEKIKLQQENLRMQKEKIQPVRIRLSQEKNHQPNSKLSQEKNKYNQNVNKNQQINNVPQPIRNSYDQKQPLSHRVQPSNVRKSYDPKDALKQVRPPIPRPQSSKLVENKVNKPPLQNQRVQSARPVKDKYGNVIVQKNSAQKRPFM